MPVAGGMTCEDCGDKTEARERRTHCPHCGLKVCRWCWHHVHRCEPNHTKADCIDRKKPELP